MARAQRDRLGELCSTAASLMQVSLPSASSQPEMLITPNPEEKSPSELHSPQGGVPARLSPKSIPHPKPPVHTQGQGQGSTRMLRPGEEEKPLPARALRAPRRAGREGDVAGFAATNCFKVGFHMFKHSERWKNYTHSPISPW